MAVEVEFSSVIIRKGALESKYPGGLDAFAASELPNYIEDDHLVRVGFMSTHEAYALADELTLHGLAFDTTMLSELALVQYDSHPDWLTIGPIDGSVGCWLTGNDPGRLIKCKNGFLLRCPRDLFDQLEAVLEFDGIAVERSEPSPEYQSDYLQVVRFARDNALITAYVIGDTDGKNPVGLWATRALSRRRHCADDVRLAQEIESTLLGHGA